MSRHEFTQEESIQGGKTGKKKPFDKQTQDWLSTKINKEGIEDVLKSLPEGVRKTIIPEEMTVDDLFRLALLVQGMDGSKTAIEELWNRAYGKAKQPIVHMGDEEAPIQVVLDKLEKAFSKEKERIKEDNDKS